MSSGRWVQWSWAPEGVFLAVITAALLHSGWGWFPAWAEGLRYWNLAAVLGAAGAWGLGRGRDRRAPSGDLPRGFVAFVVGLWLLIWLRSAAQQFLSFGVHAVDFSMFDHLFPNTANGRFMWSEVVPRNGNQLGFHSNFILLVLYPLHRVFDSPWFLILLHPLLLWGGGVVLDRYLRASGWSARDRFWTFVAYVNLEPVLRVLTYQFHVEVFFVPLLAAYFVAVSRRRWAAAAGTALAVLLIKEDAPLYLGAGSAVALLLSRRREDRVFHSALAAASGGYFVAAVGVWIPMFAGGDGYQAVGHASRYGSSIVEITTGVLGDAPSILRELLTGQTMKLVVMFLGLPLLSPPVAGAVAVFGLIHAQAASPLMRNLALYYSAPLLPLLWWGWVSAFDRPRLKRYRLRLAVVLAVVFVADQFFANGSVKFPPVDLSKNRNLQAVFEESAPGTVICAQGVLFPHVPYEFKPRLFEKGCLEDPSVGVYLIDLGVSHYPKSRSQWEEIISGLVRDPSMSVSRNGTLVIARRSGN